MNETLYQLKENFLQEWPLRRIQNMTLEEYTNLDKTSFCYWVEAITTDVGSIWGGSAYKFGIFKRRNLESTTSKDSLITDGEYSWAKKYGDTKEIAFQKIKTILLAIIENTQNNTIEQIDEIDLGDAYKWKIAFLYGAFNIINIFKNESLLEAAQSLGYTGTSKKFTDLYRFMLPLKQPEQDFFDFTAELWKKTTLANSFPEMIENFKSYLEFTDTKIHDFTLNEKKKGKNWIWISDSENSIGKAGFCHYEIIKRSNNSKILWIEIHFEHKNVKQKFYKDLLNDKLTTQFFWNDKHGANELSLAYFEPIELSDPKINEKIEHALLKLDETFGNTIRNYEMYVENKKDTILKTPLNQILYGPPGTGKTYNSINKAIEIINPTFDLSQDRKKVKDEFDRLVGLGQIVFTTFHQSMSYEDFIEGIKPKVEEDVNENKQVVYEIEDGIFKRLVENAKKVKTASKEIVENYTFDDAWNDLISEAENNIENTTPLFLPIQTPNLGLNVVEISERGNLKLKPIYSDDAKEYTVSYSRAKKLQEAFPNLSVVKNIDKEFRGVIGGSNSTAYWSILNFINQKINQNQKVIQQENILPALPHVLIIDEINRGNVSQIFGELITLIEDSKRIGEEEALEVTLSYSKKKFGVPSNVYIIGTMNTADRSVEALDTALRRRFSFVEMMPDYEIKELDYLIYNCKVTDILKKINTRIEMLLGRDYVIGHSYFLEKTSSEINEIKDAIEVLNLLLELKNSKHENFELKIEIDKLKKLLIEKESSKNKNDALNLLNSFNKNIMPLLQEYFYNDYGKIGLVLGKGFVREKAITSKNDKSIFADFDTKNEVDITKSYELIPFTEINFETAIQTLLA